jgi:hypothetical protein
MSVALYYYRVITLTDQELESAIRADSGHTGAYYAETILLDGNPNVVGPKTRAELVSLMHKRLRKAQRTTSIKRTKAVLGKRKNVYVAA